MKPLPALALAACVVVSSGPVQALDCAKASLEADKLICAFPETKKADEAMSAAYFALLRRTTDPGFHEALIRSQRRWIEARSHGVPRIDGEQDVEPDDRKVLLKITKDRLDFLKGDVPIRTMEQQRKAAAKDSGGPFAGYEGPCEFMPPRYGHWEYTCWIAMHRQHKDRICSVGEEWASGHTTERRLVSVVMNGQPKPVASCSSGYSGTTCPDPEAVADIGAAAHWNTNPQISAGDLAPPRAAALWKYDPDGSPGSDEPWINGCLFSSSFPPPDLSLSEPPEKK